MNKSNFLYGALILAMVNFIVRFIGFGYKIVLSRLIGPEGIGLFQMAFPVLMFFITFTTAGIPVAVSKLVAAQKASGSEQDCRKVLKAGLFIAFSMSSIFIAVIALFGQFICSNIFKNNDMYYLIILLAPAIMIISISSVIRGYFYGLKKVSPAGIAQIIEQLSRIVFVLAIVGYLKPINPRIGAIIAVVGISVGEVFGLAWLIINYKLYSRTKSSSLKKNQAIMLFMSKIICIAAPITLSRLIGILMQLANTVLIPQRLTMAGYTSKEAVSIFGKVMGMTMPLIFLPFIVTSALIVNIIPSLSEGFERKNFNSIINNIGLCIRVTLLMGIPLTSLFVLFSKPIAMTLYNDKQIATYLSVLGLATVFLSLQSTLAGILNGIGKQVSATLNSLIGMCLQLFFTYFLVSNPSYGINGFFIGFIVSSFIICTLNFIALNRVISIEIKIVDFVIKPIFASIMAMIVTIFSYSFMLDSSVKDYIALWLCLAAGGTFYVFVLFFTKTLPPSIIKKLFNPH